MPEDRACTAIGACWAEFDGGGRGFEGSCCPAVICSGPGGRCCGGLTRDDGLGRGLGDLGDDGALEESDGGRGLFVYECKLAGGEGKSPPRRLHMQ